MTNKYNTKDFVEKAKKVHEDKYEYHLVDYVNSSTKVDIVCKEHGIFSQIPSGHLSGKGCKLCMPALISSKVRKTKEDFVEAARKVHGDRYDYSKVLYELSTKEVEIICERHGSFWMLPSVHKLGANCQECSKESQIFKRTKTTEIFVEAAQGVHGDNYSYINTKYVNSEVKVEINCYKHGVFTQGPSQHLAGQGCPICAAKNRNLQTRSTQDEFLKKCFDVHEYTYDYSETEFLGYSQKVKISCRKHGEFWQNPSHHISGRGCSKCSKSGYSDLDPGVLYVLRCGDMTKVGITNLSAEIRAKSVSKSFGSEFLVVFSEKRSNGKFIRDTETSLLRYLRLNYKQPEFKFEGSSECFFDVCLSDFIEIIQNKLGEVNGKEGQNCIRPE